MLKNRQVQLVNIMNKIDIDVTFDFTADTPRYWHEFWEKDPLLGVPNGDPDSASKTMQLYHKLLYSKFLPNGKLLNLQIGKGANYLIWNDFRFVSVSIIVSFRYSRYRNMIEQVAKLLTDYHSYIENYIHNSYTLGGEIIFPKKQGGINQSRGCNPFIKDRWDLTLECIRRFYLNEKSPLYNTLLQNKDFFDLFVNFEGYVDFFYLQDCITDNYKVKFWLGNGDFEYYPLPKTTDEYLSWIEKELEFVEHRNNRIQADIISRGKSKLLEV